MPQRYLVFPGRLEPSHLDLAETPDAPRELYLLTESSASTRAWAAALGERAVRGRRSLQAPVMDRHEGRSVSQREALELVLADPRTFLIIEREWGLGFGDRSVFNLLPRLGAVCWNALTLLEDLEPDAVLLRSTPHLVEPWVTTLLAESRGIPVIMSADAPLPGLALLVEGVDRQQRLIPRAADRAGTIAAGRLSAYIDAFLRAKRADYASAAPERHRGALDRARSVSWNLRTERDELGRALEGLPGLRNRAARSAYFTKRSASRRRLSAAYADLQVTPDYAAPTLTVFLHYQPERTTLPEAQLYGDQYELVRTLSNALPPTWQIHVREHPATFVGPGPYHPRFRSPELYQRLAALPGVQLTTLSGTPFEAIDRSRLVATGTGTVGVEAVCRGTPAIAAGTAQYRSMPGVLCLADVRRDDVEQEVAGFAAAGQVPADPALADWLRSALRCTFAPDDAPEGAPAPGPRAHAHGRALAALIGGGLDSFVALDL